MEPLTIVNVFRHWVRVNGIVKASAASKSISQNKYHLRGQRAEWAVATLFQRHGWCVAFRNVKTSISEVDLILLNSQSLVLVEVKSLDQEWRIFERVQPLQIQRLRQSMFLFSGFQKTNPQLKLRVWIALVNYQNQVSVIDITEG